MGLRIANCSGFYGDRLSAAKEMVEGGPIDVLTGDYLAELTMAILWRNQRRDPDAGYASTFLTQMEQVLATCLDRGIKVVVNAGGLNPGGMAEKLEKLAADLGLSPRVGWVEGDNLLDRLPALIADGNELRHFDTGDPLAGSGIEPVTANAYLGGWGIKTALDQGAEVVITGRVTDAAVVLGPAAWHFGWERDDWDVLAGAIVAGHIIECGAQATGGNYSFFSSELGMPGFPIADLEADGSSVITKHPGTDGEVSVGTVTAQLLYEIGSPHYLNPDVTSHFETIELASDGPDRVRVSGIEGSPPPADLKVALNYLGGFRNSMTFGIAGLDIEEKAAVLEHALWQSLGGREQFEVAESHLIRSDHTDPVDTDAALAYCRFTVKDQDQDKVGRSFSRGAVELVLSNYPGLFLTTPPGDATPYAVYWPTTVPAALVPMTVSVAGTATTVTSVAPETADPGFVSASSADTSPQNDEPTERRPLGVVAGARSGDKGGNANVGLWARSEPVHVWLRRFLTIDRLRELMPEAAGLAIERYELPNLLAINFVIKGLLGEGVSSSTRTDPQAKSLGEFLRAKLVDVPIDILT
ncbi:MAG: acyclic terpene utilization AtuA family protein [Acidimicrobiia bacterium]